MELAIVGASHRPEKDPIGIRDELIESDVELGECLEIGEAPLPHPTRDPLIGEIVARPRPDPAR
jgi:hypothetical protein